MASSLEWEYIKKQHGNRCALCGLRGPLEKAHVLAASRGGTQIIPLCHECHRRYDRGELKWAERWTLGVDSDKYKKGKYGPVK